MLRIFALNNLVAVQLPCCDLMEEMAAARRCFHQKQPLRFLTK